MKFNLFFHFLSFQFLEQERHRLRQQLELMEDEYEQRIVELQSDIDTLKSKLAETDTSSRLKDSERSTLGEKMNFFFTRQVCRYKNFFSKL